MYSLKERNGTRRAGPILAAKRRRQLYPFFFHMGPVALCMTSVLLIGLMAVLYLSQVGQAVAANQQLQDIRDQQSSLQRQDQDLVEIIAQERTPVYIANKAKQQGLVPADPKDVQMLTVPNLQPVSTDRPIIEP